MASWLNRALFRSPLYRRIVLEGPIPGDTGRGWPCHLPGDRTQADAVIAGEFLFYGRRVPFGAAPWSVLPPGARLARALHGFSWLRDLEALGSDAARARAVALVTGWIGVNRHWTSPAWEPNVLGERLTSWLASGNFVMSGASGDERVRFLESVGRQARHLARLGPGSALNAGAFSCVAGEIAAAIAVDALPLAPALRRLEQQIARQIASDGSHVSRDPSAHLRIFRHLIDIRAALAGAGEAEPEALADAVERMAPTLRMLRHGDGRLALFQGAKEGDRTVIDSLLAASRVATGPSASAPIGGFERATAGRTLLLMDTGIPEPMGHAAPLAFELSHGRERIVVNCGAYGGDEPRWRRALCSTPAHSTVSVADASIALGRGAFGPKVRVERSRQDADGAVWLEGSHDGYRRRFGLTHRRRLYLAANGGDLRGEETLEGRPGRAFQVRFHLHPEVQSTLAEDAASVVVRPGSGAPWRFHAVGGVISIEESTYLGGDDQPRPSRQIVVRGTTEKAGARVKWALRQDTSPF